MSNDLTPEQIAAIIAATAWTPPEYFVYYNEDTGEIRSISNELTDNPHYIKVNYAEVSAIQEGKDLISNYRVVLDFKTGEYILQNITNEGLRSFSWADEIHLVDQNKNNSAVTITQDKINLSWSITVSDAVLKILSKQSNGINYNLSFYVTEPDDINVLYAILKFPVKDITASGQSTIKDDSAAIKCSVFCRNVFESYSHQII